jgi:uncharacterized membrane protein YkoI
MPALRLTAIAVLFAAALGAPLQAAEAPLHPAQHAGACLTKAEQRAAVIERRAIPLAEAIKILRAHGKHGEVVRARLCRRDEQLVYVLTLLAHNGKVFRTSVDAANGTLLVNTR